MRIGELAALVGVSTRTVRHYHHLGLLPEPERLSNGYREYRLRDAVALSRVRRLSELGLSLDEIRDVLADDRGRELREVLTELDDDLARQQAAIAGQRQRLAALLAAGESVEELDADATVSEEMAAVLRRLPTGGSAFAAFDREMLALLDTRVEPEQRSEFSALFQPLTEPDMLARTTEFYQRLDEVADADPSDARVASLAADLEGYLPVEMTEAITTNAADTEAAQWLTTITGELSPAQAQVFRLLVARLRGQR
ncbi:MerR family transcriptional regulator [Micromonospora sp. NBC_01813]|uniref:MerR family transcriptional regulator n=1 Tax=Micromonospora sp. NBC_01813 TaxID=2975988 RepID=UPI002DD80908|nr:MerR family transcriptional regulator [Micromonospora sp. NBC_01813]WSA08098.1 MerR family transcriptional regulator [Micromonospora sp. NBC_01813]